jgi:hypothetical protein
MPSIPPLNPFRRREVTARLPHCVRGDFASPCATGDALQLREVIYLKSLGWDEKPNIHHEAHEEILQESIAIAMNSYF